MALIISTTAVRDYLDLNTPGSSSKYTDGTIGSNIRAATSFLEHKTGRVLAQRDAMTFAATSMLAAIVPIPGFRTFTSVTWGGSVQTVGYPGNDAGASVWALLESIPGVSNPLYIGLQFRQFRVQGSGPWYLSDPLWFDKNLDSPYHPGNFASGYAGTSSPNDLVVIGNAGYLVGTEPEDVLHAVKVLAAFYTMRPASILADVAITPAGGVLNYAQLPAEVRDFLADWTIGRQMVSI